MNTEKQLCINWTCKISTARCHVKSRHSQIRLTISCALTAIYWVSPHWQMFDGQITRVCILLAYLEREWPCTLAPTRNSMRFCVHFWCICHFHHRPTMAKTSGAGSGHICLCCQIHSDPASLSKDFDSRSGSRRAGDTEGQMRLAHVTSEGDYRLPLSVIRGQR